LAGTESGDATVNSFYLFVLQTHFCDVLRLRPSFGLAPLSMTCVVLAVLLFPQFAAAQTGEFLLPNIRPVITGPKEVAVGKTIVLDASLSTMEPKSASYLWTREGEVISRTEQALLTLDKPGNYTITLTVRDRLDGRLREAKVEQNITVYLRKIALVAGPNVSREKIELHRSSGEELGVFVDVLHSADLAIPLGTEDAMTKLIAENADSLLGAEAIVLWADGASAMNALSRALRQDGEKLELITKSSIVLITDGGLQRLGRVIRGPFSVLAPERIIITRKEGINSLIEKDDLEAFLTEIEKRDIDFFVVDQGTFAIRPWNLLSTLVNFMVQRGVSSEMIILLLMLPVILTIISFLKQVVGVTTFGLYTPAVITLSWIALGWQIGLALLAIIIAAGYATRAIMGQYRLLYIPKIAIILTVTSIVLLLVLAVAALFGITLAPDTIFILLIMTTLGEEFMSVKAEMGLKSAIFAVGETVLVSLICFSIVQWEVLKSLVVAWPEIILLTLVINIFLGRWTGLRVSEVIRFREIFKYLEE
jgi:hypothetical protein